MEAAILHSTASSCSSTLTHKGHRSNPQCVCVSVTKCWRVLRPRNSSTALVDPPDRSIIPWIPKNEIIFEKKERRGKVARGRSESARASLIDGTAERNFRLVRGREVTTLLADARLSGYTQRKPRSPSHLEASRQLRPPPGSLRTTIKLRLSSLVERRKKKFTEEEDSGSSVPTYRRFDSTLSILQQLRKKRRRGARRESKGVPHQR